MPIRTKNILEKIEDVDVEYDGETAKVWFRPNNMTPALEKEIRKMQAELRPSEDAPDRLDRLDRGTQRYLEIFGRIVVDWEVLDEQDERVPIKPEALAELPFNFLRKVLTTCWDYESTDPKAPGTSSDGPSKEE